MNLGTQFTNICNNFNLAANIAKSTILKFVCFILKVCQKSIFNVFILFLIVTCQTRQNHCFILHIFAYYMSNRYVESPILLIHFRTYFTFSFFFTAFTFFFNLINTKFFFNNTIIRNCPKNV